MNRKVIRLKSTRQARPVEDPLPTERLSISECRTILGEEGHDLTDERIIEIRDYLYRLAAIAWEDYQYKHGRAAKLINLEQHLIKDNEESDYLRTG